MSLDVNLGKKWWKIGKDDHELVLALFRLGHFAPVGIGIEAEVGDLAVNGLLKVHLLCKN